ncbi:hypothetical protein D3C72_662250 [compost metagenome]
MGLVDAAALMYHMGHGPEEGAVRRFMLTAALAAVVGIAQASPAIALSVVEVAAAAGAKDTKQAKDAQPSKETKVRFSTVMINNKEVLRLGETKDLHADERAAEAQKRLNMVLVPNPGEKFKPVKATDVTVEAVDGATVLRLRNQNVAQVTPEDAKLANMSIDDLAQKWAEQLRTSLKDIKVAQGGKLPSNLITVAKGEMTMPAGGGAGGTPKTQEKKDKHESKDK